MNTTDGIVIIGLTGQSGAGKSTASEMLSKRGFTFINCDDTAYRAASIPEFLSEVTEHFPLCVENGQLKRRELASIVFNDQKLLKLYNSLIFPYITAELFSEIRRLKSEGEKLVILDAPTLFESGLQDLCDAVISVIAPLDVKIRRILGRDGIPVELVTSRISSQHDEDFFKSRSDWVIINDGGIEVLNDRVERLSVEIRERFNV